MSNNKFHVCFIIAVPLYPLKSGSFNCYRRAVALRDRGYKVTILCTRISDKGWGTFRGQADLGGIQVLDWLPVKIGPRFIRQAVPLFFSWPVVFYALWRIDPDIIHVINPPDIIPMIVSIINKMFNKIYIYHIADPGPESVQSLMNLSPVKRTILLNLSRFMEDFVCRNASGIITVNDTLRKRIQNTRGKLSKKPFIVQYNVSSLSLNEQEIDEKLAALDHENYVLYVGTLSTGMLGLENLINLFAPIWHEHRTKLFIIGDGPLKKDLIKTIKSIKAEEYVNILGYIQPKEIPVYIKKAKLCVIPYLDTALTRVSMPTKLFEYISLSKAVVYPDFPSFIEVLGDNNPGIYSASKNNGIINAIKKLLTDKELRKEIELMNRKISSRYNYNKEIDKIVELYNEVGVRL